MQLPPLKKPRVSHNNKVPPSAPKRNLSSFVMFANHRRESIKRENPHMSFPDIQTKISGEWKTVSDEERMVWNAKMEADKERYRREMELYNAYGIMWVHVVSAQMRGPGGWLGFNGKTKKFKKQGPKRSEGKMKRLERGIKELEKLIREQESRYGDELEAEAEEERKELAIEDIRF